ncbi:MAG TPA: NUDIX domain-containing protein [Stellaceae bacterium]|nr:NUDIX domain-containing protein [Stellaceae bacterium]
MVAPVLSATIPEHPDIEIAQVEIGFSRFLRVDVVRFRHRLFSGEWSGERCYDVLRRGDAVAIVLYDPGRDELVLVEQLRLPPIYSGCSPWQLEVVAGLVEAGETYEAVARRETLEEAGIDVLGELIPIQRYLPSPGASDESVMLFCGRVDARLAAGIHGKPEEEEDIRVVVKPWTEVEAMVDAGQIDTGHTLVCLYWLLRNRGRVRTAWGFAT